jgi:hypothetical protein
MRMRKSITASVFLLVMAVLLISTAGCSKSRQGIYLELLSDYTTIDSMYHGYLARTMSKPKELLFIFYKGNNFSSSEFKKGMTIVADIAQYMNGNVRQEYTSCNISDGSKVVFHKKVKLWYILKADIVEVEKEGK